MTMLFEPFAPLTGTALRSFVPAAEVVARPAASEDPAPLAAARG